MEETIEVTMGSTTEPIVYIPQDRGALNLSPALGFGVLKSFSSIDCPISRVQQTYAAVMEWLQDFRPGKDFLMLIGDPVLISLCIAYLSKTRTQIKLLKWDRQERKYIPLLFKTHTPPDAAFRWD